MNPTPEAVEAALAIVDAATYIRPRCVGDETVDQAAARILAAEVRRLRAAARDAESKHKRNIALERRLERMDLQDEARLHE